MNKNKIKDFRNLILSRDYNEEDENYENNKNIYQINKKDLIIYSLIKRQNLQMFIIIFTIIFLLSEIGINFEAIINKVASSKELTLISVVCFIILYKIASIIININKYYDFKFKRNDNILEISHGLLNKKTSTLNLDNIISVKITQSLLQKKLNTATIGVSTMGYSDKIEEDSVIFMNIDKKEVESIINQIFKSHVFSDENCDISPKHKIRYKKCKFGYNNKLINIENNIITYKRNIILVKEIDSVSMIENPMNKIKHTKNLKIKYKTMKSNDLKYIVGIDLKHINTIKDLIIYRNN